MIYLKCLAGLALGAVVASSAGMAIKPAPEAARENRDNATRSQLLALYGDQAPSGAQPDDAEVTRDIEAGGPWIGVQFGPVTKPLASHLTLDENSGQMILNVAEGSPADAAGFQQYDVVTAVDGEAVSGNLHEFLDVVRGFSPNESHEFAIVRGGEKITTRITIGTRPADWSSLKYKYEMEEQPLLGGQFYRRGGMLQKDPAGQWQFHNLDELEDLGDLWKHIPQFDPNDLKFSWRGNVPGQNNRMQIHINQGNEVRIEQGDDGQITVTKTERDGDNESTTTQTYDNEEAFEKGDPDSFKMFKSGIGGGDGDFSFFFNQMPKGGMFGGPHGQFKGRLDMKELHEAAEQMRRQAEDAREQAGQSRGQARPRRRGEVRMERKAGASFEVATDGSVRATIRSGDSEVVETFKNVDEMRRERPELYEKYQSVRGEKN